MIFKICEAIKASLSDTRLLLIREYQPLQAMLPHWINHWDVCCHSHYCCYFLDELSCSVTITRKTRSKNCIFSKIDHNFKLCSQLDENCCSNQCISQFPPEEWITRSVWEVTPNRDWKEGEEEVGVYHRRGFDRVPSKIFHNFQFTGTSLSLLSVFFQTSSGLFSAKLWYNFQNGAIGDHWYAKFSKCELSFLFISRDLCWNCELILFITNLQLDQLWNCQCYYFLNNVVIQPQPDDDISDRLHYYYTTTFLLLTAVLLLLLLLLHQKYLFWHFYRDDGTKTKSL